MTITRATLEAEFLHICRMRGPEWVESVIRPLRLQGVLITAGDIPLRALRSIVRCFGRIRHPAPGVRAL